MLQKVPSKSNHVSTHTDMKKYLFLIPDSPKRGTVEHSLEPAICALWTAFLWFVSPCTLQTLHSNTLPTASILVAFSTWKPYKFRIRRTKLILTKRPNKPKPDNSNSE